MRSLLVAVLLLFQDPGFTLLESKPSGGPREAMQKVVSTEKDWAALWKKFSSAAAPKVDFDKEDAIFVAWGEKGTGGHTINVVKVERTKEKTRVLVRRTPPTGAVIQILTTPYCAVRVPKITGPVEFADAP